MSATSTHDTKRSEDARMRLSVLSEIPADWSREARAWSRLNERHLAGRRGRGPVPDRNAEYYLYQTLVASFEGAAGEGYAGRIVEHLRKAAREARVFTKWTAVNEAYEEVLEGFVQAILDRSKSRRFLERLAAWVGRIEPAARVNSLALLALKTCAPGVPDVYQGSELPYFALTDPDNRRPVDFGTAATVVERLGEEPPCLMAPEAKPWLLGRLLHLRKRHPEVFQDGSYEPLAVEGGLSDHVLAFGRRREGSAIVVAVPRLVAGLIREDGALAFEDGSAVVRLPAGYGWCDGLSGDRDGIKGGALDLAPFLRRFPAVALVGKKA
jgi:(1->4)-alpha-D-glucan 1-alpha-D-glucosylmutase